ncbi:MAG: hypothetical protein HY293_21350 [Planctomycetes bacterium]|nr:hypothetical protein [Planctomycetota bacterium]
MPKTCINHKEAPAATMCHQCHSPICKSCSLVTPQGTFCSPECNILNRDVKSRLLEGASKEGMTRLETLLKLMAAFLLICVGMYGIHIAALRAPKLKKIDLIGRVLDVFKPHEGRMRE